MIYLLYILHIVVCLFLILVVLLQQGKGADLSVFGGGSTQTAFGARSAATVLHKLTVASFIAFIVTTVSIAAFQGGRGGDPSVIEDGIDLPAAEETVTPDEATPDAATPDEATPDAATPDEGTTATPPAEGTGDGDEAASDAG